MNQDKPNFKRHLPVTLSALVFSGLFSGASIRANELSVDDAINKAGKQRMITQRILKDYALIGISIALGDPAADLKELIDLFDSSLSDLKKFSTSSKLDHSLAKIESLWLPIKETLRKSPVKARAATLQEDLDKLLAACNENTRLITDNAQKERSNIINLAGRQRMLSQRMAALYMLKTWQLDDPKYRDKLAVAMEEFSHAQNTLETSPLTTDEIHALLARVRKSFAWFELMGNASSNRAIPNLINKSANSILADMDSVTRLYADANN